MTEDKADAQTTRPGTHEGDAERRARIGALIDAGREAELGEDDDQYAISNGLIEG